MKYYLGVDLGGTNIAIGLVNENYEIVSRAGGPTKIPRPAEEVAEDIVKFSKEAVEKAGVSMDDVQWVGIGTPGTANRETGIVEFANNLLWHFVPLRDMVQNGLNKEVWIENDANAAAYGEALAGAAKGVNNVIAITLGTGLGGGIIIDKKIYAGTYYAGAELGHMVIVKDGKPCTCGRRGCTEAYASATGLINLTKDAMLTDPEKKSVMWELCGGDMENASGRTAFDGMRKGDALAKQVVDEYVGYLACAVANYVNIFQPEILVVGGGISKEGETLLGPVREIVDKDTYCVNDDKRTKIMAAELGNDAGIIGAAFLGNLAE